MSRFRFSKRSLDNLVGVHPTLVDIVHRALATGIMDFSVVAGVRTIEQQRDYVNRGVSKTMNSKHLIQQDGYGHAVDLYPWPINMPLVHRGNAQEIVRFGVIAGIILTEAKARGVFVVWGGDWNSNGETLDHTFFDSPHFELRF